MRRPFSLALKHKEVLSLVNKITSMSSCDSLWFLVNFFYEKMASELAVKLSANLIMIIG